MLFFIFTLRSNTLNKTSASTLITSSNISPNRRQTEIPDQKSTANKPSTTHQNHPNGAAGGGNSHHDVLGKGGQHQHHHKQQRPRVTYRPTSNDNHNEYSDNGGGGGGDDDDLLGPSGEDYGDGGDSDATQPTQSRRNDHHFSLGEAYGIGAGNVAGNVNGGRQHGKHGNSGGGGGGGGNSFGVKEQRKPYANGGTPEVRVNTVDNEVSAAHAAWSMTHAWHGMASVALAMWVTARSALRSSRC